MKKAIPKIPRLIWKRLPYIVVYSLTLIGILFICEFMYYRYAPAERFIHYTTFQFNTVEEHKDVPFEACKRTNYQYKIEGNRKIYLIPQGKGEIDKILQKTYPLDSIISKAPCVNAFITNDQFDFTAGHYQVYTTFNFKVKYGNPKSITFKSNVFTVLKSQPVTVEEIQQKIDELQKEIDLLKAQLQIAQHSVSFSNTSTPTAIAPSAPQSENRAQPATSQETISSPSDDPSPAQQLIDNLLAILRTPL